MIFNKIKTLSLLTLLPLSNDTDIKLKACIDSDLFINGYNSDENKPWLDSHIFLVFDLSGRLIDIELELLRHKDYITSYSYRFNNKFYQIYVLSISYDKVEDRNLIRQGRISELSNKSKSDIQDFWKLRPSTTLFSALFLQNVKELFEAPTTDVIGESDLIETLDDQLILD